MTGRKTKAPIDPDRALWDSVTRDVTPLNRPKAAPKAPISTPRTANAQPGRRLDDVSPTRAIGPLLEQPLDRSWQKRFRRGRTEVDRTIDLHGLTQTKAHNALTKTLAAAVRADERIVLVITGTGAPKTADAAASNQPRGVLRNMLPHWIEAGPYAGHVIAIRPAHPVHGGSGAFYVLLRRKRAA
ncbi:MAG: Smr/MutS family protein [Pseudomonadota bacterium]